MNLPNQPLLFHLFYRSDNSIQHHGLDIKKAAFCGGNSPHVYAKSFKEAQSIAAPLNIAIVFTAVIGTMPVIELNAVTALIPLLNVSLASKDIFAGVINPLYMIEVYLSLFGFAILSVLGCARAFNDENTIFRN